jgi:hypothetical protein
MTPRHGSRGSARAPTPRLPSSRRRPGPMTTSAGGRGTDAAAHRRPPVFMGPALRRDDEGTRPAPRLREEGPRALRTASDRPPPGARASFAAEAASPRLRNRRSGSSGTAAEDCSKSLRRCC